MAWHIFEKLLEEVANYSPFVGKVWVVFLFLFRLIMVVSIGDTVYGDEQSSFKCNTLQPGCENVCFNHFSPISQIRFWAVQILFVGTPSIMFIVYATHRMRTIPQATENDSPQSRESQSSTKSDDKRVESGRGERLRRNASKKPEKGSTGVRGPPDYEEVIRNGVKITISSQGRATSDLGSSRSSIADLKVTQKNEENIAAFRRNELKKCIENESGSDKKQKPENKPEKTGEGGAPQVIKTPDIVRAYAAQAVLRTVVESGFLYLQYRMYQFVVPEVYVCDGYPCPRVVECFVSRPMEKTLFLRFMYVITIFSLLLNVIELYLLLSKWIRRTCCAGSKKNAVVLQSDRLPMEEIIIDRPRGRHVYRRARTQNTFPDLGPFPRFPDGIDGDDSDNGTMDSDYRFYDL